MAETTDFWHEKLHVYHESLSFVARVEGIIAEISGSPAVVDQLDRAAERIAENIVNGNSQWSVNAKCRYFDIAKGSALECAACLDICHAKRLVALVECSQEKGQLQSIVRMLAGLIRSKQREVCESPEEYGVAGNLGDAKFYFDHERLDVYQFGLRFVGWLDSEIRRADVGARSWRKLDALSTSIVLNIAEGNGRINSADHRRFLEIAHSSALKAALQLDLLCAKTDRSTASIEEGKKMLASIVRMLLAMRGYLQRNQEQDEERDEECPGIAYP
jgi:four helix bundle protein